MTIVPGMAGGPGDRSARLRDLLEELQDLGPRPRSGPIADLHQQLCAEVEAILHARREARDTRRSA